MPQRRVILHSDLNSFYASVECLYNPVIRDKPVSVAGDPEARHGIILASNQHAKRLKIKTGMAIHEAKKLCPNLVVVPADFKKYIKFGRLAREIYGQYTDQVEPYGLDEAWLDVTASTSIYGDGHTIADTLRKRMKDELGITCSVGVADNKIFSKLGSDMKKPDATTIITPDNYRQTAWSLPAGDLLYVGPSTKHKLFKAAIYTIGDIATSPPSVLQTLLGKPGLTIWHFANGLDNSVVKRKDEYDPTKSISHSTTTPRDLVDNEDVALSIWMLCESVAMRLRDHGFRAKTVQIYVRNTELQSYERQAKLQKPSQLSSEIAELAMELFRNSYPWEKPVRSVGVRAADLVTDKGFVQLSVFEDEIRRDKQEVLERAVDDIRRRFGHFSIQRGVMLKDRTLTGLNPREDHTIHPVSFF